MKILFPFKVRFVMLHNFIHDAVKDQLLTSPEAVQMISVLCKICPRRETSCQSYVKDLEEFAEKN